MALQIKGESYKVSEFKSQQIDSAVKNTSEEKAPSAQETPISTNEKQTKGARELATSKKADAQLQGISLKMQLAASESSLTTFSKPANNVQQLGPSSNDQGAVVGTVYAQQMDSKAQPEKQSAAESLRKEIAGALNVPEDSPLVDFTMATAKVQQPEIDKVERPSNTDPDPNLEVNKPVELSDESVKHNQEIIDAALTYGRKTEKTFMVGKMEVKQFTEYIPSSRLGDMDAFIRHGYETTLNGETLKVTKYLQPGSPSLLGIVFSTIKDGKETITKVIEDLKGAMGLKEGDTRDVPPDSSTPAGKMPSSWDPQPNGRYGKAGQPKTEPNNSNTNNNNSNNNSKGTETSSEKGGLGRSLDGSSGGSMGFEAVNGGDSGGGGASSGNHQVSYNNGKTWESSKNPLWETKTPPTQVEVEKQQPQQQPAQHTEKKNQEQKSEEEKKTEEKKERDHGEKPHMERPQKEATHEPTKKDHGSQAAYGDYADLGVTAPATYNAPGNNQSVIEPKGSNDHVASSKSDLHAKLYDGPYNFGNPLDAALNEAPAGENPIVNDQNLTYTAGPSETNFNTGGIGLDNASNIKNTGNPLLNSMNETPSGNLPGTGEEERNSD